MADKYEGKGWATQYTPGPWKAGGGISQVLTADGRFAVVQSDDRGAIGNLADVDLIAAAPELLEALEGYIRAHTAGTGKPNWKALHDAARAALAKARGES